MRGGLLASVAVGASLIAGCGQQLGSGVLDSATTSVASASVSGAAADSCAAMRLTIGNADNGKRLCVRPGAKVLVLLVHGIGAIQASGPLTPRADGALMLMRDETGAAFTAERAGDATITSAISPCDIQPGMVRCFALVLFRVRLQIRGAGQPPGRSGSEPARHVEAERLAGRHRAQRGFQFG